MSLVIPPGFAEASVEMRNDGDPQPWFVTFGVDVSAAGGDFQAAANDCAFAFASTIGLQVGVKTRTVGCNLVVGQDGPDHLIIRSTLGGDNRGTSGAAMLPQNCAALYDKFTDRAGRRGKGRFFMPNILPEEHVSEVGVIDSGTITDLQVQASAFLVALADGNDTDGVPMVLLHNAGPGSTTPDVVTALVPQTTISTQRRRLR